MGKGQSGLKINKDSHLIKKSSVSKAQQRQPVIIYTHSPKVIQTHPRNFMELVQKLTGLYRSEPEGNDGVFNPPTPPLKEEARASPVITEEVDSCSNCVGEVALKPPLIPDYVNSFLSSNGNKPLLNFVDPSFLF